jgi:hypothetical protein
MRNPNSKTLILICLLLFFTIAATGCDFVKSSQKSATLLQVAEATQPELEEQVNYLASVDSMRAKMYLKFEDNSYAEFGSAEVYRSADGDVVVQRPANIRLKVEVPVIGTDVAQMTSDGTHFRVAILQDGGNGKNKKFILGTNSADYSVLQKRVGEYVKDGSKSVAKSVNAFANMRPQHFTEALLVRPIDTNQYAYLTSSFVQEEVDFKLYKKKDPLGWVLRTYYLLDEFEKLETGDLRIKRRFWFDRVGGALLTRQQIFDSKGEIESDIVYGRRGAVSEENGLNLPLEVKVTRPKEKYKMTLKYQAPLKVKIGNPYPAAAFVLENDFNLEVLDLDQKLAEIGGKSSNVEPMTEASRQN